MGLMEKLGLGSKRKNAGQNSPAAKAADRQLREDEIPAAAQDMCCGSCGGRGHAGRKDGKE